MKAKSYLLSAFLLILSFNACDNFLEREPYDQLSQEIFYKSRSHFEMSLAGNYRLLQGPFYENSNIMNEPQSRFLTDGAPIWDVFTDNCYGKHSYGNTKEIVQGNLHPTTGGFVEVLYNGCYNGIARANIFLKELADYSTVDSDMTEKERNIFEGEVRFIRAYYYFHLYMFYGDVPLVIEPLTIDTQKQPKVPAKEILSQILMDIDFAIENLTDVRYYNNNGHVTKSTAQALKARVLMFSAYDNTGVPDLNTLKAVRDICLEIMPLYDLCPDYKDLFLNEKQINNPEIIWSINYLGPNNNNMFRTFQTGYVTWNPLQNLIDEYECIDGLPFNESPLADPDDIFKNRDQRLKRSIYEDIIHWDDGTTFQPSEERITGYGIIKYIDQKTIATDANPIPAYSDADVITIRFAEVLLMYAEAQNEIIGPDVSVHNAITEIRVRAGLPPLSNGLTKEQMRENIRHERRVEFPFENGLRFYDLKRWRICDEVLNNVTDGIITYRWEDRFYRWPLPQTEIEKSDGVLVQNPDYI
jgi:hypothetical protein